ncbi:XRE family transcriptional regulator [Bordetella sp. H567]|uniref:helix-turn-helix domain-containing protein n=1 Tax=Bordetella sp. H567 TaxID=1697043 RepID=UPI00081C469B|nr:helix-turn-helix transcriptional regulator [Bordetella sp. H567]AOB32883.1 XRE family transcriptional regulator [Bordetella sp. H567]
MKKFSDRLRHIRSLRGYTQAELARLAGLSQSAVASYESGERKSSRGLFKLAAALGVEAQWLDTGKGPMERPADVYAAPAGGHRYALEDGAQAAFGEARKEAEWPFPNIPRGRYESLTARDKRHLENMVAAFIDACHSNYAPLKSRNKPRRGD